MSKGQRGLAELAKQWQLSSNFGQIALYHIVVEKKNKSSNHNIKRFGVLKKALIMTHHVVVDIILKELLNKW